MLVVLLLLVAPQGLDVLDLVRAIRAARSQGDANTSRAIRLVDPDSETSARLRVYDDGAHGLYLAVELAPRRERLFAHSFRITLDDAETLRLRILEQPRSGGSDDGEVVIAPLAEDQLEALAAASRVKLSIQGWDETFEAEVDEKGRQRIERFRDQRQAGGRGG